MATPKVVPVIMTIDDDPSISKLVQYILEYARYQVESFNSGALALSELAAGQVYPDLILLDLEMPDLNGYDICLKLQEDPVLAMIPVVFLSGGGTLANRLRAFQLGAIGFLEKPIDRDSLLEQVAKYLKVRESWRQSFSLVPDLQQEQIVKPFEQFEQLIDVVQAYYQPEENLELEATGDENAAPLIRLVNRLIDQAYQMRASDIHIQALEDAVLVRYRIDGELRVISRLQPLSLILPLVARIKIMSGLNIDEKRLPQDGRIVFKEHGQRELDVDLRVATAPMNFGEKVVMRLIDKQKSTLPLEALGLSERNLVLYREQLGTPYGMILHVGPTGSGKSMTLYSALNELNRPEINIQTAEDPIEYTLPGIAQLQVKPEIGLTFARALRAYLRQDPDVILVGEIRDRETAHIALEAALTGHLLLSTLHTNDAAATLTRFIEMGMEPFMVSAAMVMICAQRLLRRLCPECRLPYEASNEEKRLLSWPENLPLTLYRAPGCDQCEGQGYRGRIGVHELLIPSDTLRQALCQPGISAESIKKLAVSTGMTTLFWDGADKVRQGLTSLAELCAKVRVDEFDSTPAWWGT